MSDLAAALADASLGEIALALLMLTGALFCVVAAVGVLRLEDVLMRMHATSKAGTLGAGLIFIAAAFALPGLAVAAKAIGTVSFILLTAPVAAHVIGRAAYRSAAPLSARTWIDERSGSEGVPAVTGGGGPSNSSGGA